MMPAMNSAPTDVLVATAYITITIDGGIRMPSAPDVVMTPAPKRAGKPCLTIAGRMIEPIATTVAGDAARHRGEQRAGHHAGQRRGRPCQWPTIDDAKLIIRRATPPWVRKLPARMKNGIAMISNFSMPVNSLSATDSIGTVGHREQVREHGEAERDRDRHPGQHQAEQQREDDPRVRDRDAGELERRPEWRSAAAGGSAPASAGRLGVPIRAATALMAGLRHGAARMQVVGQSRG